MSKEQQELLYEAFKNYLKDLMRDNVSKDDPNYILLSKEEFIKKCKTDNEFSEKWGLKIEERELSLGERGELFRKTYPYNSVDDFAPSGMEIQSLSHQLNTRYEKAKIPTKLITLTYNDETIEIYE